VGKSLNDFFYRLDFLELTLPAHSTLHFKAITCSSIGRQSVNYPIYLFKPAYLLKYQSELLHEGKTDLIITFFFFCALVIMMLYMGILFFHNQQEKMYLFYALYMFFTLMYMLPKVPLFYEFLDLISEHWLIFSYTNKSSQMALFIFTIYFVSNFWVSKNERPNYIVHLLVWVLCIWPTSFFASLTLSLREKLPWLTGFLRPPV